MTSTLQIKDNNKLVVGIGSALVDILVHKNDEFLNKLSIKKGGMTLVDNALLTNTLSAISDKPCIVPGGSACNTIIGIASLGGQARFVGKLGTDEYGEFFTTDLKKNNVDNMLFLSSLPTGRVLSIITPDAQRTMLTYLGASSEIKSEEITDSCFLDAGIVHIEGYMLFNRKLMLAVMHAAKKAGSLISLDLASFTIVEESKKFLKEIVDKFVDIVIANEDEAIAYTGYKDELKAVELLSENVKIAVLKIGKRGSFISYKGKITKIESVGNRSAVDTTGAGDLWASGFLFGLVNKYSIEKCGQLGSLCGYEVCQVVGANIPDKSWNNIKKFL